LNSWDNSRMTAVHSDAFASGPGGRLFYHATNSTGAVWVQEMIWDQLNDSWTFGAQLYGAVSNSHLAAVIDAQSQTLRLFYTSEGRTLKEMWLNIKDKTATYQPGMSYSPFPTAKLKNTH
jgi:hypothetical protein